MRVPHRSWAGLGPVVPPISSPGRSTALRCLAVVGCALLGQATMPLPQSAAWAQTVSSATVTEVLDGNQVFIQEQRAAVNSVAQRQQRVRTQAARASLRFDNGAVARLSHNSSLVVGQCAQLNRGTLLVNGSLNGCSTTTIAGVRGTIYTMEVTEAGETIIQVFEGEVTVGQRTDAPLPDSPEGLDSGDSEGNLDGGMPEDDSPVPDAIAPSPLGDGLDLEVPYPNPGEVPSPEVLPTEAQESPGAGGKQTPPSPSKPRPTNPSGSDPSGSPTDDSVSPFGGEVDLKPNAEGSPSETVEFNPDTVLVINEGQQVTV
ncbi:MAG: hypothetical protein VKI82_11340, partial [Leptolyngbya sp.]|nr:hypothetical protein [Leptolyngbya sp.]